MEMTNYQQTFMNELIRKETYSYEEYKTKLVIKYFDLFTDLEEKRDSDHHHFYMLFPGSISVNTGKRTYTFKLITFPSIYSEDQEPIYFCEELDLRIDYKSFETELSKRRDLETLRMILSV